mgnify:CR=1 FL=1
MNIQALIEIVNSLRDKVIAAYRVGKVNELVEKLQNLTATQADLEKQQSDNVRRIGEISDGKVMPGLATEPGRTAEEAVGLAIEKLGKENETVEKDLVKTAEKITETNESIAKAKRGEKPYRMNRETVTERVAAHLRENGTDIGLEELSEE